MKHTRQALLTASLSITIVVGLWWYAEQINRAECKDSGTGVPCWGGLEYFLLAIVIALIGLSATTIYTNKALKSQEPYGKALHRATILVWVFMGGLFLLSM